MEVTHPVRWITGLLLAACAGGPSLATSAAATGSVPSRIVEPLNPADTVLLTGNTSPLTTAASDLGLAAPARRIDNMVLVLERSADQDRALTAFNERQYDPGSADYHHWLQPGEFGRTYGPSDADIAVVTGWLRSQGFTVDGVNQGRTLIQFSGSVAQVQAAFHIEMHRYLMDGEEHLANDRDPRIPRALSPVVGGVAALNDFSLGLEDHRPPQYALRNLATGKTTLLGAAGASAGPSSGNAIEPDFTYPIPIGDTTATANDLVPYDLATLYNSLPLWKASPAINGTGVAVGVLATADVIPGDYARYRQLSGLPATTIQVLYSTSTHPGTANGIGGENTEDVEMVSAAAPGATIALVTGPNATPAGILSAATYAIDQNKWPILTASYGECELFLGKANNNAFNAIWQQGASQGISIFVAAGDQGSTGCTGQNGPAGTTDHYGLVVNGLASSPYVTAVGGTDLDWNWISGGQATYWGSNNPTTEASAKGYIPEIAWNTTCANTNMLKYFSSLHTFPTLVAECNGIINGTLPDKALFDVLVHISGGSGGISNCTTPTNTTNPASCSGGYAKPSWQTAEGVPTANHRYVPDIAMFGSYGWPSAPNDPGDQTVYGSAYLICFTGGGSTCVYKSASDDILYERNGGTSAATPYSAGVMAMVLQKLGGARQGLANPVFYKMAQKQYETQLSACNSSKETSSTCYFHDVTAGSNAQPCGYVPDSTTFGPDCVTATGDKIGISSGYSSAAGYDLATGLGTLNIANLVDGWTTFAPEPKVSVSPSTLKFSTTAVGKTSAAQVVTVKNSGTVALSFWSDGLGISGTNAGSFLKAATTCGTSLAVGASCTISVEFKPAATGTSSATLSIIDNAAGPQKVTLTGDVT
jgi:subtilase family serine protease